ncbi:hypothetical protein RF11_09583 [Thelohanellus kitauei]|uniref:Uncharacterized protein n=1 Tax=Thelohanellus kitauei TaxID=669202 RepID=A0A0C2MKY1_THEKT|nr:hypothetical protein RF11_09583 [Thelohanellus kitauei]
MSNAVNDIMYVSKNGGWSFNRWIPTYNGNNIHANKFIAIKHVLFGISDINRTFFYVDVDLNIFSVNKHGKDDYIVPSNFDPSFVFKLVKNRFNVSHIIVYVNMITFFNIGSG